MSTLREMLRKSVPTSEAAEIAGMTPASFRKAMTLERRAGNDIRTRRGNPSLWSEAGVRKWLASRPGQGRRPSRGNVPPKSARGIGSAT